MKTAQTIGAWIFVIGIIVAIIAGFISGVWIAPVLVVLGLLIGFLNVTTKETQKFLLAVVAIAIVSYFGGAQFEVIPGIGVYLANILQALLVLVFPAAIVVGLKEVFALARD